MDSSTQLLALLNGLSQLWFHKDDKYSLSFLQTELYADDATSANFSLSRRFLLACTRFQFFFLFVVFVFDMLLFLLRV